jgi:hypothetical protein
MVLTCNARHDVDNVIVVGYAEEREDRAEMPSTSGKNVGI